MIVPEGAASVPHPARQVLAPKLVYSGLQPSDFADGRAMRSTRLRFYAILRIVAFVPTFLLIFGLALHDPKPSYQPILWLAALFLATSVPAFWVVTCNYHPRLCALAFPLADSVFITAGAFLLGGPNSEVVFFFMGPIVVSAWLVGPKAAVAVGLLDSALYALLVLIGAGYVPGWALPAPPFDVYGINIVFRFVGFLTLAAIAWGSFRLLDNLLALQQSELIQLFGQTRRAQEAERKLLAADLHDTVAQWLTGALFDVEVLRRLLQTRELEKANNALTEIESTLQKSIREVRATMTNLHPSEFESEGLVQSLTRQVEEFRERTGVEAVLQVQGEPRQLVVEVQTGLCRIAQEALNNVAKHSRATRVVVGLQLREDYIVLTVRDNGRGFELGATLQKQPRAQLGVDRARHAHQGLLEMCERVEMLGGKLHINSDPRRGTRVVVTIQLALA